jgi:hypothetical protein
MRIFSRPHDFDSSPGHHVTDLTVKTLWRQLAGKCISDDG